MQPAPKPLSMFTTDTPLAQLFSIPSRAASPWKLAPYPMLVGTATTGTDDEARDHAGERAFHAGDDDDDAGGAEPIVLAQQAVKSGDADVVEPVDRVAHHLGGDGGFLGDGQVRRAGRRDEDGAAPGGHLVHAAGDGAGHLVILGGGHHGAHRVVRRLVGAGDEQRVATGDDAIGDGGDLIGRLAQAEDDFGEALALGPLVVDAGEPDVLDRLGAHFRGDLCGRIRGGQVAGGDLFQQAFEIKVHG